MKGSDTPTPGPKQSPTPERDPSPTATGVTLLLVVGLVAIVAPVAMPPSYSWIRLGTSESAAQGLEGAWVTRAGFIMFGLAVLWLAGIRRRAWGKAGTFLHRGFAVSLLAVAAFSIRSWEPGADYVASEDLLHSLFATVMGLCFIAGVLTVMVARRLPGPWAALPDIAAATIPALVSLAMSSPVWGLLQRIMFITAAAWYAREALHPPPRSMPAPRSPHNHRTGTDRGG